MLGEWRRDEGRREKIVNTLRDSSTISKKKIIHIAMTDLVKQLCLLTHAHTHIERGRGEKSKEIIKENQGQA